MEPTEIIGAGFVMGILGIGATFSIFVIKSLNNICQRLSHLEGSYETHIKEPRDLDDK